MADKRIMLAHGDGGALTHRLVQELFLRHFPHPTLHGLTDGALLPQPNGPMVMSTDSFVVNPIFFPGGDIGKLAVAGTVNDLAVSGARPLYLSVGFILEEGLPINELEQVVHSLAQAAEAAGVAVVAGDTKVVEKGHGDGIYINSTGIGVLPVGRDFGYHRIAPGDIILINGFVGDHGLAILSKRAGLTFDTPVQSDCAPLNGLIETLLERVPKVPSAVKFMRDPTRGGVATTLKEIALSTGRDIYLDESSLPLREGVQGAAELLGLDPLYLANEGKVLVVVAPEAAEAVLAIMGEHPLGRDGAIIGRVSEGTGQVYLRTPLGGHRILDMLAGDPLPRIC
ncbi:hydrogenase expression/formation protein HypE [Heliobacterium chlorum]|nr:hydrogenase expression/formation protein HypE [Heliobacterium chlorum]